MKTDIRNNAVKSIKMSIAKLKRSIYLVKKIPLNVPLHIVYENCSVGIGNGPTTRQDNDMVIIVVNLHGSELSCQLLAVDKPWWEGFKIHVVIDYVKIKSWKLFDSNDAGLYINWTFLTDEFKKIAFG